MTPRELEERFWAKVERTEGCWLWRGTKARRGYGVVIRDNKRLRAHRVAWRIANGPIPCGLWVLHKCDTPACCRPDHLFLGTHDDNVADQVAKSRHAFGSRNGRARFTEATVAEIRSAAAEGESQVSIARRYGTKQARISEIVLRKHWRHVP